MRNRMTWSRMTSRVIWATPAAAALAIAVSFTAQPTRAQSTAQAKADECLARPGATTPRGSHWYYRRDRATGKRCWYLGAANMKVRAAAPAERSATPTPPPRPSELRADEQTPAATPADVTTDAGSVDAGAAAANSVTEPQFSAAWPAAPDATQSNERDATAAGGGNVEAVVEDAATTQPQQEDMPLVWPALTPADRAVAAQPSDSAPGLGHLAIFLAAAAAFIAIALRAMFKLASAWFGRGEPLPAPRPAAPVIRRRAPERPAAEPSFEAMAEPTIARLREIAKRWEQPTRVPRQPRMPAYEVAPDYEVKAPPPRRQRVA